MFIIHMFTYWRQFNLIRQNAALVRDTLRAYEAARREAPPEPH